MGEFQAMADDRFQQEPSVEDILASIRRILSEDGRELQSSLKRIAVEPMHASELASAPELFSKSELLSKLEPDLKEKGAVEEKQMLKPAFEKLVPDEPNTNNPDSEEEDVLELTDAMLVADEALAVAINHPLRPPRLQAELKLVPELEKEEEGLISIPTAALSAAALNELARKARERNISLRHDHNDVTLESLVREVLRPLLKAWLDENLLSIVEGIVGREIKRLVHKIEDN